MAIGIQETEKKVMLLTGWHDAGKGFPEFQGKWSEMARLLKIDPPRVLTKMYHAAGTAVFFKIAPDLPMKLHPSLGIILGGHHGVFPLSINSHILKIKASKEYLKWLKVTSRIVQALASIHEYFPAEIPFVDKTWHGASPYLAGFISIADWIASDETSFPFDNWTADPMQYNTLSEERARDAVEKAGFIGWDIPISMIDFTKMFPYITTPWPLQLSAIDIASTTKHQGMVIIEAQMGEGKTEAALYIADGWMVNGAFKGMYYALPTQATSDQMFLRVEAMLKTRYPGETVTINLVHGQASISAELKRLLSKKTSKFHVDDEDSGTVMAAEWFTHKKQGLLCPFGIGTIDQALLSVLQTKHFFVRLFALGGKIVIFDEVHAYDAYMLSVLNKLVQWLAVIGSPVIILSATLPNQKKKELLESYATGLAVNGNAKIEIDDRACAYPRISAILENEYQVFNFASSHEYELPFSFISRDPASIIEKIQDKLARGGCCAVICNTVKRAQQLYRLISDYFNGGGIDIQIIHARYIFQDRETKENNLLDAYGKVGTSRPGQGIIVATQVVEQSLDLDFDFIISDLAPIDLLLQRAGRMHRHERPERPINSPELCIGIPEEGDGRFVFGDDGNDCYVYDEHILLKTWLNIKDRTSLQIPSEIDAIIEAVYGASEMPVDLSASLFDQWTDSKRCLDEKWTKYREIADVKTILNPSAETTITSIFNRQLEEDDYEISQDAQALTRISTPSIPVVLAFDGEDPETFRDEEALSRSITISSYRATPFLDAGATPASWRKNALLRFHRAIKLDANNENNVDDQVLKYDAEIGLTITNDGGAKNAII